MRRSWLWVVGFCLVFTVVLVAIKYNQIMAAIAFGESLPEPSETVEVAIATKVPWQASVVTNATLVAPQSLELITEAPGRITDIGFESGGLVAAGQILVQLDISTEQAELSGALASLNLAELQLERTLPLFEKDIVSPDDVDIARANVAVATARVEALKAEIAKKIIIAPFDAYSGLFTLAEGQYLDAGTLVTRLVGAGNGLWVDFYLPQHQASLDLGSGIQLVDPKAFEQSFTAKVIAVDAWISESSRNRRYRAELENAPPQFVAGASVKARVPIGGTQTVIRVPSTAVRYSELGANVYTISPADDGKDRATQRQVVIGEERDGYILVVSGLFEGERIAANGSFKLRDGLWVHGVNARPAPANETALEIEPAQ